MIPTNLIENALSLTGKKMEDMENNKITCMKEIITKALKESDGRNL